MNPLRGAGLAAALLVAGAAAGCGDFDVVTNTFATLAEAQAAGAVQRGWVPELLPAGAHDIREAHDEGGTKRRWGLFSFKPADDESLRQRLGAEMSLAGIAAEAPPRIEWWPILLRGQLDGEQVAAVGLKGYQVTGDQLVAAVNWNQRRAYYWSPQ